MTNRVLLIGNGPSALQGGLGAAIDALDGVVARFNDFRTAGFQDHVGSRTDEWITWHLFDGPAAREFERVLCVDRPPADTFAAISSRYPHARRLAPDDVEATIARMGYEHPSSGALAAMTYLRAGWEVLLHGFDFFQARSHHYSDAAGQGPKHSGTRELLFFSGLMRDGAVRFLDPARAPLESAPPDTHSDASRILPVLWEENRRLHALSQEINAANLKLHADLVAATDRLDRALRDLADAETRAAQRIAQAESTLASDRRTLEESRSAAQEQAAAARRDADEARHETAGALAQAQQATSDADTARAQAAQTIADLEASRRELQDEHGRVAAIEAEVLRLRASLGRQLRVNVQSAAATAADLSDQKRLAAGAAWARESLVQRLHQAIERR